MMSDRWTPDTDDVREIFSEYDEKANSEAEAEFDRWLAKHDEKVARDAVKAERLRILGLLESGETMHSIWWVLYRGLEPNTKSGRLYQTEIADLLRAELMGADDE
jgi:hypothetical protein